MRVESLVIVGGGSSGWMSAAALSKLCPHIDITIIESPNIKTVGVGESTLGHITKFLDLLGLEDKDWMAECNATYKNSIRFTNFRENDGTSFQYPFSLGFDMTDKPGGIDAWSELATVYPDEFTPDTFAKFYATANTYLSDMCKGTTNADEKLRHYSFKWDTAYHVDAAKLGQYLKNNIAMPNGVTLLNHDVVHVDMEDDQISGLLLDNGETVSADLYIDCTGFQSMLLEKAMKQEFLSFDDYLANDCAWACRVPYEDVEKEMHPYTDCHALDNGWVWHIPLWNRIGTGYVYSSKFTTADAAKEEFRKHLATTGSKERADNAEMFHINIKHGRRRRGWVRNVVGIGLSYGFVEPLESTGLLTTHENLVKLVECLNRRNGWVTRTEKEGFNYAVESEVLKFRDFISTHYALSMRDDTPYWKHATEYHEYCPELVGENYNLRNTQYQSLIGGITLGNTYSGAADFPPSLFLAAGMGVKPKATKEIVLHEGPYWGGVTKLEELDFQKRSYEDYRDFVIDYVSKLPSHYEFLKNHIYGGKDDQR
jgi:2-polyprenyl-6-methoxyphenol hydroxylase-like FAD-dependent oxidoreductase